MAARIPDLWRTNEDAARLYRLYLAHLQMNGQHVRVVSACRQIRRYAARGPGPKEGLFTFCFEIDSLGELKDYKAAWRQLRVQEKMVFGQRLDLSGRSWTADEGAQLTYYYAPLLFFLRRYRQGCTLLETSLDFWFAGPKVHSYQLLHHICNGDEEPWHRCRVTLSHFYARLGKDLRQWRHWQAFVNGFHPRHFRRARLRREQLLAQPGKLIAFCDSLMAEQLVKRQQSRQQKVDEFEERIKPTLQRTHTKLQQLFPELQALPHRHDYF